MYEHMVFFKFNDKITFEKEQELLVSLQAFKGEIPGIIDLTAGFNVTEEKENHHGYSLGLRVTFENKQALDQYGPHPIHQRFVNLLDGIITSVVVVDYPI